MRDCYIPDLTERYPEGLDGVDMFEPYDIEAVMWSDMEKQYEQDQKRQIEQITRAGFELIEQTADGWTFAESDGDLILLLIDTKTGEIIRIDDRAKDRPENRESMFETWQEIASEG